MTTLKLAFSGGGALLLAAFVALGAASAARAQEPDAATPTSALQVSAALSETTTTLFLPIAERSGAPSAPYPSNGLMFASLNANLLWSDPSPDADASRYTLFFEAEYPPDAILADGLTVRGFDPPELKVDTRYWWQVVAHRPDGTHVAGPVWTFKTEWPIESPDVAAMVVVPGGTFRMGCDRKNPAERFCSYDVNHINEPVHEVRIDTFEMDRYEVTNREYRECMRARACRPPRDKGWFDDPAYALAPITFVSWWDAQAFCHWEGKRLPTEAEWEMAARGTLDTRVYPWGNEGLDCSRANHGTISEQCQPYDRGIVQVGNYPRGASPYGVHDLAGNVFEWVQDKYDVWYYRYSPDTNPQGPPRSRISSTDGGGYSPMEPASFTPPIVGPPWSDVYSLRGGSWGDRVKYLRVAHRHWGHHGYEPHEDAPWYRNKRVGFRCARSLP